MTPNADGPDTSHWNKVVDAAIVPSFPLWSTKITEGASGADPQCAAFLELAKAKGAEVRGVYHWLRPDAAIDAQVANLQRNIVKQGLVDAGELIPGVIIQLDWEKTLDARGNALRWMTVGEVEDWVARVTGLYGDRVIVYGANWVQGFAAWRARNPQIPVWYAGYNLIDGPKECARFNATVWQWTDAAAVPGFDAEIDMNHVFDWAALRRLANLTTPQPTEDDMARLGPYLIQSTGKSGDTAGSVYACDGQLMTLRHIPDPATLTDFRYVAHMGLAAVGQPVPPELLEGGDITAVDDLAAFGVVIGTIPSAAPPPAPIVFPQMAGHIDSVPGAVTLTPVGA